ncbi:hypothetical protein PP427_gp048 [Salmonella phage KM16]|nr:hypothetical protein PP427_gp048 [Salmonella phage KM16]
MKLIFILLVRNLLFALGYLGYD